MDAANTSLCWYRFLIFDSLIKKLKLRTRQNLNFILNGAGTHGDARNDAEPAFSDSPTHVTFPRRRRHRLGRQRLRKRTRSRSRSTRERTTRATPASASSDSGRSRRLPFFLSFSAANAGGAGRLLLQVSCILTADGACHAASLVPQHGPWQRQRQQQQQRRRRA